MDEIRKTMMPEMIIQTELSVSIANRIYECLEQRNMTQKDLARMMGKTETEVSRWLSGLHSLFIGGLIDHPLGGKAVEGRDAADGEGADEEEDRGPGHFFG